MSETQTTLQRPGQGKLQQVAPGVHWLAMPMSGSLAFINLYLLEDHHGWWIVDTGLANSDTEAIWDDVFSNELGGKPVVGVICTHMHPDHIGQAKTITDRFQCALYMTQAEYYQARSFPTVAATPLRLDRRKVLYPSRNARDYLNQLAKVWENRASEGMTMPDMVQGYERLRDGQRLRIGDTDWQIVVGSGHSPEHACLYSSALKVLISGDQIAGDYLKRECAPRTQRESTEKLDGFSRSLLRSHPRGHICATSPQSAVFWRASTIAGSYQPSRSRMLAIEEACVEPQIAKDLLPVLFAELDSRQMMARRSDRSHSFADAQKSTAAHVA